MAEPTLWELIAPGRAALVQMEMQRGVVGDLARIEALQSEVAASGIVARSAAVIRAARRAGVPVVHCSASFRRDRAGSYGNVPMVNALLEDPDYLVTGSPAAEVLPELGPEPGDVSIDRQHGMSPFHGTPLEPTLRAAGITTVVAVGVSLNIGIFGLAIEAINRGYRVVVPSDCVVGFPADYGRAVLRNSLSQIALLPTAADVIELWSD